MKIADDIKNVSGIYAIVNTLNGKRYIGMSRELRERVQLHRRQLERGIHYNCHLQRSFNKGNLFIVEVLELCEIDDLQDREIYWLDHFGGLEECYNQAPAGICGNPKYGKEHHSYDDTIYKIYHNDYGWREFTKSELAEFTGGEPYTFLNGKRRNYYGWRFTEEYVTSKRSRYSFKHKDGRVERNIYQADMARKYEINNASISAVVKGKRKTAGGWSLLMK